jgi:hypothetical protein
MLRIVMCVAAAIAIALAADSSARAEPDTQKDGKIGGRCLYVEHPGHRQRGEDTGLDAQASLNGGPGYEGLAVTFTYAGAQAGDDALVRQALAGRHELRLINSWYPGPRFLDRYGIAPGKSFACTLEVISQGTCTPVTFDFPGIDRADYFESEH